MSRFRPAQLCAVLAIVIVGCRSSAQRAPTSAQNARAPIARTTAEETVAPTNAVADAPNASGHDRVAPVAFHDRLASTGMASPPDPLFAGDAELSLPRLVQEVESRNPSLQAMVAAWQAAAQRYPQAISLDDPMLGVMLGPGSWGSDDVDSAYMIQASQKLPWHGKRRLRGQVAWAESAATRFEIGEVRLRLVEAATLSFFDLYVIQRDLELNDENKRIMLEFRDSANAMYAANLVTQQDVLQAEVELAELERRRLELERMHVIAVARINTLLHRGVDQPLPSPPARLLVVDEPPPSDELRQLAVQQRPDLAALEARIRAQRASLSLATKEFYPDLELVGRYDAFWQEDPLRTGVGVNLNVPVYRERRHAAVREAMFRLNQYRADYQRQMDEIQNDVQTAYARLIESRRLFDLYSGTLIPVAVQNVESARAGYVAAKVDFLRLVEAQRQRIAIQEQGYQAEADCHSRLAELNRAVGGSIPATSALEELPLPIRH